MRGQVARRTALRPSPRRRAQNKRGILRCFVVARTRVAFRRGAAALLVDSAWPVGRYSRYLSGRGCAVLALAARLLLTS